eukprot:5779213-Amphidinium_carterae.1
MFKQKLHESNKYEADLPDSDELDGDTIEMAEESFDRLGSGALIFEGLSRLDGRLLNIVVQSTSSSQAPLAACICRCMLSHKQNADTAVD